MNETNLKIDRRRKYGIIIDTETANSTEEPLFYDVGWAVIDSKGNIYKTRSFVNRDVFIEECELMQTAYYAEKIPKYCQDIRDGKRILTDLYNIKQALREDVEMYECQFICAHNARFDYKSLNLTQRYVTKSKYRYFTPYGLEWQDTQKMAHQVIVPMPSYKKFCEENGFITKTGRLMETAEVLSRFIMNDLSFIEEHTGLEDVFVEVGIYRYCVSKHKAMDRRLFKS